MADLEPSNKKKGFFSKITEPLQELNTRIHSVMEEVTDVAFETLDAGYYLALEEQVNVLLKHPETIHDFIVNEYGTLLSLFSCSGPSRLEETIDLNLEKDFRLVSGSDLTPELKDGLKELFVNHRDVVHTAIQEVIRKQKVEAWADIGNIKTEDISELVRMELATTPDDDKVKKLVEVYCKIIRNRKSIDSSPQEMEEAYNEVSFGFYRNLKMEMNEQGIWDKKQRVRDMEFDDDDVQLVWQMAKEKILENMEYDSYLG